MNQILTNEELVSIYQEGNINALEALWLQNIGLIRKVVRKMCFVPEEFDDELQEAFFAMRKAALSYKPGSNFTFTTALCNQISWDRSRRLQTAQKKNPPETVSIDTPVSGTEDLTLGDTLIDERENVEESVLRYVDEVSVQARLNTILREIITDLPPKCRRIMEYRLCGFSQADIARKEKVSSSTVSAAEEKARRIMKRDENVRKLQPFFDYYGITYKHSGFRFWKETGYSSVEWAVEQKQKYENQARNRGDVEW